MNPRFAVGIDLGTTNSLLAYCRIDERPAEVRRLPIPQLTGPSQIESLASLPSFVYVAPEADPAAEAVSLDAVFGRSPYSAAGAVTPSRIVVGEFARRSAAEHPERTVVAAKSWLSFAEADREAAILPWGDADDSDRISPVAASRLILEHLIAAWQLEFPDQPLEEQQVVLTVPASFDLAARELTLRAAREAGLPENLIALEEPQAALYHWISQTGETWRRRLSAGESVLVCDVGGGTTDLSLIRVEEEGGEVALRRVAVGEHLLVGGDNMDLALAHHVSASLAREGHKLNPWQSVSLWHSVRTAKESLLGGHQDEYTVTVLGRGSRLIGGSISTKLTGGEVAEVLVEGFFPRCELSDRPEADAVSGFREIGLPYEQDTAITRHVAAFLSRHAAEMGEDGGSRLPGVLLFNGGVFKAASLRERMTEVVAGFRVGDDGIRVLGGPEDLDAAVACGAAYYGWSKRNGGVRIRGGPARSYYVGIESAGLAVPGMPRPVTALCVVPKGMEEGTHAEVPSRGIGLVVGQEANFRFFASTSRPEDQPGAALKFWDETELVETSPMRTLLEAGEAEGRNIVPVRFESKVTELGVLELWCREKDAPRRWKLELNVRGGDEE